MVCESMYLNKKRQKNSVCVCQLENRCKILQECPRELWLRRNLSVSLWAVNIDKHKKHAYLFYFTSNTKYFQSKPLH